MGADFQSYCASQRDFIPARDDRAWLQVVATKWAGSPAHSFPVPAPRGSRLEKGSVLSLFGVVPSVQKLKAVGRGRQSTQVYVTVAVAEVAALASLHDSHSAVRGGGDAIGIRLILV